VSKPDNTTFLDPSAFQNKDILISGGAGVLGRELIRQLIPFAPKITVVDNFSPLRRSLDSNQSEIEKAIHRFLTGFPEVNLIQEDLRQSCKNLPQRPFDLVFHLAAEAPGLNPKQNTHQSLYQNNLQIGQNIARFCQKYPPGKLLFTSSSCVYPDDAPVPTPEIPLQGTTPEKGNRGYGQAKKDLETLFTNDATNFGYPCCLIRLFNLYSPEDTWSGPGGHVIPSLRQKLLNGGGQPVVVWGSGNQTRAFLHTYDASRAIIGLIALPNPPTEVINVGSSKEFSMKKLIQILSADLPDPPGVIFDSTMPEGAKRKACDATRLKKLLPWWEETIDLEEALRD